MKFVGLALFLLALRGDAPRQVEPQNFIIECYRHCDVRRGECNGRCGGPYYPKCDYARCQEWYRICLSLCNKKIILNEPPEVETDVSD